VSAPRPGGARTRNARGEPEERIAWRVLQDERLSFRALGVLSYLLSLPDSWQTSAAKLASKRKEGRDAVETALSELDDAGYLVRKRIQYRSGQWGWLWIYGAKPEQLMDVLRDELRAMADELHPTWIAKHLPKGNLRTLSSVDEVAG
jgi:predicted transcriptional regulator